MENIDIIKLVEFLLDIVQAFDGTGFFGQMCTMAAQKQNMPDTRLLYRLDNIGPDLIVVNLGIYLLCKPVGSMQRQRRRL